jgi:hypothetical protein
MPSSRDWVWGRKIFRPNIGLNAFISTKETHDRASLQLIEFSDFSLFFNFD